MSYELDANDSAAAKPLLVPALFDWKLSSIMVPVVVYDASGGVPVSDARIGLEVLLPS